MSEGLRRLEAAMLEAPGVIDCVVRERASETQYALVAFVVSTAPISLTAVRDFLPTRGSALLPTEIVRVPVIPLTADGRVDDGALARVPVLSDADLAQYRAVMLARAGVTDAAVRIGSFSTPPRELSVADLLPASRTAAAPSNGIPVRDLHHAAAPSIAIGEPIAWTGAARPLADILIGAATHEPDQTVTCVEHEGETASSYAELLVRAQRIMNGLRDAGLRAGDRVILQIDRNSGVIDAFWGCVLGGFVPAPLAVPPGDDPNAAAAAKLGNTWELLGRPLVVTTEALEPRLAELGHALGLQTLRILTIERLSSAPAGGPHHEAGPDDIALLLLTSGSTGVPKAVTQTHASLHSACVAMAQRNGFSRHDVVVNWISLDHVGGIVMCHLMFVALRARQVHVRTDLVLHDPLRWLDLIDRHRGSFTWAPNFAFALVNDRAAEMARRRWDLSSMRCIVNGGEAVVAQTARRFLRLLASHGLPATCMRPTWGMSETSSAAVFADPFLLDTTSDDDELVELGPPDPGFQVRIVDERGDLVPEGSTGQMEVRGPNVTRGYFNNPAANAESFTTDGWFRTGDLGRLSRGRLTITGREKGVIIINGVNYHAHEVETAVEDVAGITPTFTAAFAVREPGAETDSLAVAFHTTVEDDRELAALLSHIRAAVLERVGVAPTYLLPVSQADIPKTDIGKIQRRVLSARFEAGGFAETTRRISQLTSRSETLPDWFFRTVWRRRHAVRQRPIGPECTFVLLPDSQGIAAAFERRARGAGANSVLCAPRSFERCLESVASAQRLVIVSGWQHSARSNGADEATFAKRLVSAAVDLVQVLARSGRSAQGCELIVYDDEVQHVSSKDRVIVAKSAIRGIIRTAAAEHPQMSVRHVDLPAGDPRTLAALLQAEVEDRRDEPEVAYRDGDRWVRRLVSAPPVASDAGHRLSRSRGFYLVTGGAGGVGSEICRNVLRTANAPLLLIGRTAPADMTVEQRASLAALQARGHVQYEVADVADFDALEGAVTSATARFGMPLAGVIHLAGAFEPRLLIQHSASTLAPALAAKIDGAWNLHRLLLTRRDPVFIAFSSVNGHLGGYSAGAYAAANAFLDGLVEHQVKELGRRAYSLGWSLWDGVGLSRTYAMRESAERRGFRAVSAAQGWLSFQTAIGSEPGHVLIGLDATNPHILARMDAPVASAPVVAEWTRDNVSNGVTFPPFVDRFGTPVPVTIVERGSDPGSTPTAAAPVAGTNGRSTTFDNDLERSIAAVWQSVLPGDVGPNDNFFDAGGNSVLVAQASRAMQNALGRSVPITDIYRFPTLRLLAGHYGGQTDADQRGLDDSESRGQSRRMRRQQRSRRDL